MSSRSAMENDKKTSKLPTISIRRKSRMFNDREFIPPFYLNDHVIDVFHPRATRKLVMRNLDTESTTKEIKEKMSFFGKILDIKVEPCRAGMIGPVESLIATIHYSSITAVSDAIKYFREEMYRDCRIKCDFAHKGVTFVIWIDASENDHPEEIDADRMQDQLAEYGTVVQFELSSDKLAALVYFASLRASKLVVAKWHGAFTEFGRLQVDYVDDIFEEYVANNLLPAPEEDPDEEPVALPKQRRHSI